MTPAYLTPLLSPEAVYLALTLLGLAAAAFFVLVAFFGPPWGGR